MMTWVYWMFGLLAFRILTNIISLGIASFPLIINRGHLAITILINIGFLIWGIFAIWG